MKHWRAVLAILIIFAIVALVLISPAGENIPGLFGTGFGGFSGFFTLNTGKVFSFSFKSGPENFYGMKFQVANSTFSGTGVYTYIKIAGQNIAFRDTDTAEITINSMAGQFQYLQGGIVRVSAETNNYLINDLISVTEKPVKIEFEISPVSFIQTGISERRLDFENIEGTLSRYSGDNLDVVAVSGRLTIDNFYGSLRLDGTDFVITGVSSLIKGDGFTFG